MNTQNRRDFLKTTSAFAAATALGATPSINAAGANGRIRVAVIGPGGRGTGLLKAFAAEKDVEITYVCDVDKNRLAAAAKYAHDNGGHQPGQAADLRQVLADKDVDAVVIGLPDHWHAPATILACDAGKHVYVEKPCSHNIREGRVMLEAARRNKRVVQTGTQTRSSESIRRAMELLHNGAIGDIITAKVWNSQLRRNIGKTQPSEPPATLDYDAWVGPAPMVPYRANMLPGIWRWWHNFGAGDIGNDGVHDLDVGRWGLGIETHPNRVAGLGGKYFFDDDQEFPDTMTVAYEYDGAGGPLGKRQLIFEQRIWSPYVQEGHENGNAWYGTKGMMVLGKARGWQIFGPKNVPGERGGGGAETQPHVRNFLDCIQSGARPTADVEIGHYSATLAHLGNIVTRIGRTVTFDPKTEQIVGDEEANKLVRRQYREGHWAVPKGV